MSGEKSENLPADEQQKMLQEFLELQKQDIAVKQKELESRKDEIQSHNALHWLPSKRKNRVNSNMVRFSKRYTNAV
ncbi:putative membrane protein [Neisseria meningitidis NM134]|uniref:hypothetical protein n=1 Tax=Neisseria meningitidis TaxID=487 RepID=UPI000352B4A4|nr:hypothetical protein [Neisseria meningitidis]EPF55459.1 putative membrane protein [Neisseria meningitidis NM134]EPF55756.1 putative membrane protein [Neisseria meningitidis NM134]EPF55804.1 putative membrane protein [Neisseria meningitidis NM134]EPF56188.1 putative membrane protein [Neisseria meningitidis NM134]